MAVADAAYQTNQYYIVSSSPGLGERSLVLKQGDMFAVFDSSGNIDAQLRYDEGLYFKGTRFLSSSKLSLSLFDGLTKPHLLSSSVRADDVVLAADMTNPDVYLSGRVVVPRGAMHIHRRIFLWSGVMYEEIAVRSYAQMPIRAGLVFDFDSDYCDIFEVRGQERVRRGSILRPRAEPDRIALSYEGLDGVKRSTGITFQPAPGFISGTQLSFTFELAPYSEKVLSCWISCELNGSTPKWTNFAEGLHRAESAKNICGWESCEIETSDEQFNSWLERSQADIGMMLTETPQGLYPYAGVPWFSTPFGRDGIVTALECLWVAPSIARGVLSFLAATQATEVRPEQDAEPGKILHEARDGEMAALHEIPFGRYYGSIDATPLFIILAGSYCLRTADLDFIRGLWRNIEAAITWIDKFGDVDGDGFVEYEKRSKTGLIQQGWKDSQDSVFYENGELARPPIALCEVQGYVYAAKKLGGVMARALGLNERAQQLHDQAEQLRARFNSAFWNSRIESYALALDGQKKPCVIRSSNAGQCLLTAIAEPEKAQQVAQTLMDNRSFSGWGIRTVSEGESRYNPMSYHNGSVWPHDNALISLGLARYGYTEVSTRLLQALFEASAYFEQQRLPELFCGFDRSPGKAPTLYPVACSPQTWSAGAAFMLLQSALGIWINAPAHRVVLSRPNLPKQMTRLEIRDLKVANSSVDILVRRDNEAVSASVIRQKGQLEVILTNDAIVGLPSMSV